MKLFRILALASVLALVTASASMAEKLVIAGRDGGYASALSMMVDAYKAANPGLEVDRLELPYGGLLEKVTISMREKAKAYDVIMLDDTWAVEFMSRGWLADLDKLGGGLDKDFVGSAVAVSRYPVGSGPLYAVPFVGNVELFAYRSDLLKKHLGGAPKSWSEVLKAAKAVAVGEKGVSGVVFRGKKANSHRDRLPAYTLGHGGAVVDSSGKAGLDSDAALKALNLFLELKKSAPKGVETYNSSEVRDALMQGTTAMSIELWPSWAPSLDDPKKSRVPGKIEIMAAPGETEQSSPMLGTWLLAVPADAPIPREAAPSSTS